MEVEELLGHEANPAPDVGRRMPGVVAEQAGLSAPCLLEAQGRVDERRLARAVAA